VTVELRETLSGACFWLADNFTLWQPFGLLVAVGLLILALTVLVEMAS
jgi:hypothetical protein